MRVKTTLPISKARENIFSIAEDVQENNAYYTLTERGYPKAVMLSAKRFERLSKKSREFILEDRPSENRYSKNQQSFSRVLIVRDASKVVYLEDDQEAKCKEEDLIKAQLYVKLIEKYAYPLKRVEIGRYVKVGGRESKRFIEADIIINDEHGNVEMIFEVCSFSDFEERQDKIMADLFDLAYATTWAKKPKYLVCFSRARKNNITEEKIAAVDYTKFNTFSAWKKAGRPCEKIIPDFKRE